MKTEFMDDYILRISTSNINTDKSKERIDWIQKQLKELTPFKIKSVNLENLNNSLIKENKYYKEILHLKEIENDLNKKINEGLVSNLKNHEIYADDLESKLCYVKDFVYSKFPNSIEDLKI